MWIDGAAPERVAELFENYGHALAVFGKGSESGSRQESAQSGALVEAAESRQYFAQPCDAEWGC